MVGFVRVVRFSCGEVNMRIDTPARIGLPEMFHTTPATTGVFDGDGEVRGLLASGDVIGALQHVMQRHGASVYRYCREALRDATLADDVHQQVFIEAFRDLPRFESRSTVRTWLFAIARHRVLDAARVRSRTQARTEDAEVHETADLQPMAGESIDEARLREALVASLGELDPHVRSAVLLHYQQGFTFAEVAAMSGEKPGTVQARVTRALPQLRARIEAYLADRPGASARRGAR
jgi:RNA polymerase sigma-70 factor (ECF subfamily)